jgi:adenylylsulfate kinase/chloramphenicol 3-O phosphotransferase
MEKGKIIFLNGVTSSGKTTIVEALQERRDVFFYVVANDLFQEMVERALFLKNKLDHLPENQGHLYDNTGKTVEQEVKEVAESMSDVPRA